MTSDKGKFAKLVFENEGFVTYGDKNKRRIPGTRTISNGSSFNIKNFLLVEELKHNLINISQFCDKGYKVVFELIHCLNFYAFCSIVIIGERVNNIYFLDLHHALNNVHCFLTKEDYT